MIKVINKHYSFVDSNLLTIKRPRLSLDKTSCEISFYAMTAMQQSIKNSQINFVTNLKGF